nr:hypothetical protein GCM10020185_48280 [Pseudomonas brassicacearum subsp. brassicacearum]
MALAQIPLRIWRQRSQIFMFRGHAIRYWVAGQGEPLLLIHGFSHRQLGLALPMATVGATLPGDRV